MFHVCYWNVHSFDKFQLCYFCLCETFKVCYVRVEGSTYLRICSYLIRAEVFPVIFDDKLYQICTSRYSFITIFTPNFLSCILITIFTCYILNNILSNTFKFIFITLKLYFLTFLLYVVINL